MNRGRGEEDEVWGKAKATAWKATSIPDEVDVTACHEKLLADYNRFCSGVPSVTPQSRSSSKMLSLSSRTHSTDKSWVFRPRLCPFNSSPLVCSPSVRPPVFLHWDSRKVLWHPRQETDHTLWQCLCFPVCVLSHVQLFVTPWIVECQAPLSMGFSMQEYWSGLPFPPPGGLPNSGWNPHLLCLLHCRRIPHHWATWESLTSLNSS